MNASDEDDSGGGGPVRRLAKTRDHNTGGGLPVYSRKVSGPVTSVDPQHHHHQPVAFVVDIFQTQTTIVQRCLPTLSILVFIALLLVESSEGVKSLLGGYWMWAFI